MLWTAQQLWDSCNESHGVTSSHVDRSAFFSTVTPGVPNTGGMPPGSHALGLPPPSLAGLNLPLPYILCLSLGSSHSLVAKANKPDSSLGASFFFTFHFQLICHLAGSNPVI